MTELNSTPTEEQLSAESIAQKDRSTEDTVTPVMFWGTIAQAVIMLLMTVAVAFLLFSGVTAPALEQDTMGLTYVAVALVVVIAIANIVSIVFTIREKQAVGYGLTFFSFVVFVLSFILVVQGRALSLSFFLLIPAALGVGWICPPRSRRFYIVSTAIALLLASMIEWINPPWRIEYSGTQIGPIAAIIFAVIFSAMVARQAWKRNNIRSRFLTFSLGLTLAGSVIIAILSVNSLLSAGAQAQETSSQALREQVQEFLSHQTTEIANKNDLVLQNTSQDAEDIAQQAAYILANSNAFNTDSFWNADEHMFIGPEGQYVNGENDISAVFIPNTVTIDDNFKQRLETLAYLNMAMAPVYEGDPNSVAIYFVGHDEITWFYPNINLGTLVPPDYLATQDIFYTSGSPENNPDRKVVWTPVYDDPAGQGLLVSAIAPVYRGNTFEGVIGIDVSLANLTANIETEDFGSEGTYAFLLDSAGRALALPGQAYVDLLGREREPGEFGVDFANSVRAEFAPVIEHILSGEAGFHNVVIDDQEYLVAHAPLTSTDWYLVSVASAAHVLAPAAAVRTELEESSNTLVFQRILPVGLAIIIAVIVAGIFFTNRLVKPIEQLKEGASKIGAGEWDTSLPQSELSEIDALSQTLSTMATQLKSTLESLEERVAERTSSLELAAQVGRTVSQVSDLDSMLTQATQLMLEQFDLYYVQIYLTDSSKSKLTLEAGTGEVGQKLLERQHSLPLSLASINGRAAVEKRPVVISDTQESTTFRKNPMLPDTRGEMALPLIVGDRVVGVLDLQTRYPGKLTEELVPAYEALAGQLAVAIQNATLLKETEQARADLEAQARRQLRVSWDEHLDGIHKPEQIGFVFDRNEVLPFIETDALQPSEETNSLTAPISLAGEKLGALIVELGDEAQKEQNTELVSIVARQVAQQIENLRLLESADRYRQEAEQAARRQTVEGWQEYVKSRKQDSLGYMYDLKEVRPHSNGHDEEDALTLPLKVRSEAIGKLSIQGMSPDDQESLELVNAVAESLSAHIESLRQYDQTQTALAQSRKLFEASRRLTQAADLQELVEATVTTLGIPEVNRALLTTFDYDAAGDMEQLTIIANWWNETGNEATPIGTRYPREVIRVMPMFVSPTPVFFNDTLVDERVDATTMELVKKLNLRAVAALPLHIGSQQIGSLILEAEEPHDFTPDETRLFESLAPQIATVLENRQQYQRAQHQAEREAMLNTINQKIQSATSVEAVLQIAARELGHALGAPMTIAQLSMKGQN